MKINGLLNLDPHKVRQSKNALKKSPWPMDYWKTNFVFNQVTQNTEKESVAGTVKKARFVMRWYIIYP